MSWQINILNHEYRKRIISSGRTEKKAAADMPAQKLENEINEGSSEIHTAPFIPLRRTADLPPPPPILEPNLAAWFRHLVMKHRTAKEQMAQVRKESHFWWSS